MSFWSSPAKKSPVGRVNSWLREFPKHDFETILLTRKHVGGENDTLKLLDYRSEAKIEVTHFEDYVQVQIPSTPHLLKRLGKLHTATYKVASFCWKTLFKRKIAQDFCFDIETQIHEINQIIDFKKTDIILATGPPFEDFWAADFLTKKFGCKWVADYRDLWTKNEHALELPSEKYFRNQIQEEQQILNSAEAIVTVWPSLANSLSNAFPDKKVFVSTNGFAESLLKYDFNPSQKDKIILIYIGTIYPTEQDFSTFISAINTWITSNKITKSKFCIQFIGSSPSKVKSIFKGALSSFIDVIKWVDEAEMLLLIKESHALFMSGYASSNEIITSKIFDYIASSKPILFLGNPENAITKLLEETNQVFSAENETEVIGFLNSITTNVSISKKKITNYYTREFQSKKLADFLNTLI